METNAQEKSAGERKFSQQELSQLEEADQWTSEIMSLDNPKERIELAKKVLDVRLRILGENSIPVANGMLNLAAVHHRTGDYNTALQLREKAISINRALRGNRHPGTAFCLEQLTFSYDALQQNDKALEARKKCYDILVEVHGPLHDKSLTILSSLGSKYFSLGKSEQAITTFEKILQITSEDEEKFAESRAFAHQNLAVTLHHAGQAERARKNYENALKIALQKSYKDMEGDIRNGLGSLYLESGDLTKAIQHQQEAFKIKYELHGIESVEVAVCLLELTRTMDKIGDPNRALQSAGQAFKNFNKHLGPSDARTRKALYRLSEIAVQYSKFEAGLAYSERLLKMCITFDGESAQTTSNTLRLIGFCHTGLGNLSLAADNLKRSSEILRSLHGENSREFMESNLALAQVQYFQGNRQEALELVAHSLAASRGHNSSLVVESLELTGTIQASLGKSLDSVATFDELRRVLATKLRSELTVVGITQQADYLSRADGLYRDTALSLALEFPKDEHVLAKTSEWLLNVKSLGTESLKARIASQLDFKATQPSGAYKELAELRSKLSRVAVCDFPANKEDLLKEVGKFNTIAGELGRLERKFTIEQDSSDPAKSWILNDELANSIPVDSAFVDIAKVRPRDFHSKAHKKQFKDSRYVAWIHHGSGDRPTEFVDLGDAAEIETLITNVLVEIENCSRADGAIQSMGEQLAAKEIGSRLSKLAAKIWSPLRAKIGETTNLVISPDSMLWLVPWDALPETESEFLIERRSVRLVSSGRELMAELAKQNEPKSRSVVFADPLFESQLKTEDDGQLEDSPEREVLDQQGKTIELSVKPLPFTRVEAQSIGPTLEKYAGKLPQSYFAKEATERNVRNLRQPQIAVFSTHGFFRQSLLDTEMRQHLRRLPHLTKTVNAPFLRSGLLFAGCNNTEFEVTSNDGILTALEVLDIDFRGTELVVLSACDSATGDITDGEGVAGLRQAFQLAGAESVVATLWSIPDRDSAYIMADFFLHLADGKSRSKALRQAQLTRIKARRARHGAAHPFFWAAFTLTGQD